MANRERIIYLLNDRSRNTDLHKQLTELFSQSAAQSVRAFHQSFPEYKPTPLIRLNHLAETLGVAHIWIKDESYRFGLKAFKVLGGTHALAHIVAERLGLSAAKLSFDLFKSPDVKERLGDVTFVTATDGNHGRGVAWAAQQLDCHAVIYLPRGVAQARYEAIKEHGADTFIIDGNYDDAVHLAAEQAEKHGWTLVQDTAWHGYEEIPTKIMQGYLTILHETLEQLNGAVPTHVFVQCGVGSLAASLQAYLVELYGDTRPLFNVVEPTRAACFYKSMAEYDGTPKKVTGPMDTIMAGLACGEPSTLAWAILQDYADVFIACPDYVTIKGMRLLGNPLPGDARIISGESGAVTLGLLVYLLEDPSYRAMAKALRLDSTSKVLLISTESDTDPAMYRKIVRGEDEDS